MISCEKHDYIEIACMFKYPVKLTMKPGGEMEGVAQDVVLNEDRLECMELKTDTETVLVILENILKMDVLIDNPNFKSVSFN